ncbi:MAG: ATP-binding protein [Desulfuromonadaceae bacterium]|nr:ATP-binding protein [Desulfuromonadaceae bacterium]MDD2856671.1 ATP-binding protein [Desulfuromonadaceae bacterium]
MEYHHRLIDIINSLPDATLAINRGGCVIAWNRSMEELTGVDADAIMGRDNYEHSFVFYGERRPILLDLAINPDPEQERKYEFFKRTGDKLEAEKFIPKFRAGGLYVWATARCLLDSDGKVIGAIETVRDITERKRLQEIIMQTEKMIMIGGLTAGMAHEINNPLGAIMQNAQNIERRISGEIPANLKAAAEVGVTLDLVRSYMEKRGIFDFIGHIRNSGMRASEIISNMLHFSNSAELTVELTDISELLDRVLELAASDYGMKKKYNFKGIEIRREFAAELPLVPVVVADMEQALLNIIKNAAQAIYAADIKRHPVINLRTSLVNEMLVIEIEDNGSGMSESTRLRVFEPFFSTKEVGVGIGLGMSVVYAIVTKNHNGRIEVTSQQGEGSCFRIMLPLDGV